MEMNQPLTTTLNRVRDYIPERLDWEKLLCGLGKANADDDPLEYARILEILGFDAALLCCSSEPKYACEWRAFAVWCARTSRHLATNKILVDALNVAERHIGGSATKAELEAANKAVASIAVYGDRGAYIVFAATLEDAASAPFDIVVLSGDNQDRDAQKAKFIEIVGGGQ